MRDLNRIYQRLPALYELDDEPAGFRWIDCYDAPHSVISFVRFPSFVSPKGRRAKITSKGVHLVAVVNLTPVPRHGYRIGVPRRCDYLELLNTDARDYGGSGMGNLGRVTIEDVPSHGFAQSVVITLPPLATLWFVPELDEDPRVIEPDPTERTDTEVLTAEAVFEAAVEGVPAAAADEADLRAAQARNDRSLLDESTLVSFDRSTVGVSPPNPRRSVS